MQSIIAAVLAFLERHSAVFASILGTATIVDAKHKQKESEDAKQAVKDFQEIERRSKSRGDIERLRRKYGKNS